MKRRQFIRTSALATSIFASTSPLLRSKPPTYRLALIGSGWWGNNILREALASGRSQLVGICDVDEAALKSTTEEVEKQGVARPKWYKDFRECLTESQPEIVIVATPDHWHALNAIEAIEAGAHVYLEKPISHTLLEGRAILKAARQHDRVVQVGTHRRVSPHNIAAMDLLRSGKVGDISMVKCFVNYGQGPGEPVEDTAPPDSLDWDMWLGPAPYRDFNPRIHPRGFRQFLDFANGTIGDWGIHWFDQVLWWTEERYPKRVFSSGGRYIKADNSDAPDTQLATYEFEDFVLQWEHKLTAKNANEEANVGCYFYGSQGTLHMGWRDGATFYPSKKELEEIHIKPQLNEPDQQNIKELWTDFLEAIEHKRRPTCDIEHGYLATNLSLLGMISMKVGRSLVWDGEQIVGDESASELMRRDYRAPWIYPKV